MLLFIIILLHAQSIKELVFLLYGVVSADTLNIMYSSLGAAILMSSWAHPYGLVVGGALTSYLAY
jgi:hypothetical protein